MPSEPSVVIALVGTLGLILDKETMGIVLWLRAAE